MKAALLSHYPANKIMNLLVRNGFHISADPEFVFTYGGDGTILEAEHKYPGVPVVPVQKSEICANCSVYSVTSLRSVLEKIKRGNFSIKEEPKIEAVFQGRKISALNEVQVHVRDPRRALRFSLRSGKTNYRQLIGDGIIASTPFGSTAYYRSIGYKSFRSGLRIGFNNVWPKLPYLEIKDSAELKLLRGEAWLTGDNCFIKKMDAGDRVVVMPSKEKARFVLFK
jgi:NAD+ kinase